MTTLLHQVVERLRTLPDEEQDHHAARILEQLERYEALREDIREGERDVECGDTVPFDAEDIIRRGHERRATRS